jgi:hypothetical protein
MSDLCIHFKHLENTFRSINYIYTKLFLIAGIVRGFVSCHECGKRRVVYRASLLTAQEQRDVLRVEEEMLFVYGSPLFPGSEYQNRILVRQSLICSTYIETQYYAGKVT